MPIFKDVAESSNKRRRRDRVSGADGGDSGKSQELTAEEDVITILNAVIEFRANNNGNTPTPSTMAPIFDAIKDSLNQKLTGDQLYRKFRTLKDRYRVKSRMSPTTPFDYQFLDLSGRAWGEKEKENETVIGKKRRYERNNINKEKITSKNNEDNNSFKLVTEEAKKHWKATKMDIPFPLLELGLEFMNKEKAVPLEKKWEKHIETGRMIEMKTCDMKKEYLAALCGAADEVEK